VEPELYVGPDFNGHYRRCKRLRVPCYCYSPDTEIYRLDLWPAPFDLSDEGTNLLYKELLRELRKVKGAEICLNPTVPSILRLPVKYVEKVHPLVKYVVEHYRAPLE